jgi:beta-glucanase (GH16 family)
MRSTSTLLSLGALLAGLAEVNAYALVDNYDDSNFFHEFDFFSAADPTHGFIQYQSATGANTDHIAGFAENGIYLGLDHTTVNPQGGRASVRVSSQKTYNKGLFIADIQHAPSSTCGVWPAFWTTAEDAWPNKGEIDIIEGVNAQMTDIITLHTGPGCSITSNGGKGQLGNGDCNADNAHGGCSQQTKAAYGDAFNDNGGGVYAMEWTSDAISIWHFARAAIPADITAGTSPDPSTWGQPDAKFVGGNGCNIDNHFQDHKIIFNIATCGDWAGQVWGSDPECSALAKSCNDYVGSNPQAFVNSYFLINSVKVFQ